MNENILIANIIADVVVASGMHYSSNKRTCHQLIGVNPRGLEGRDATPDLRIGGRKFREVFMRYYYILHRYQADILSVRWKQLHSYFSQVNLAINQR